MLFNIFYTIKNLNMGTHNLLVLFHFRIYQHYIANILYQPHSWKYYTVFQDFHVHYRIKQFLICIHVKKSKYYIVLLEYVKFYNYQYHQLFLFQIIIIYSCQHRHRLFDKFPYLLSPFSGNDIFFRRSFKVISAARKTRLSLYPLTIPARVFILHGITIIPIVR